MTACAAPIDDPAVSEEAKTLRERLAARSFAGSSITLGRRLDALNDLREEIAEGDRDPTATIPSPEAFALAEACIQALPTDIRDPELLAEPDGEIALEWQLGRRWIFSISVGPRQRLSYAGLFGGSRVHGTEQFTGEIPQAVTDALRRLLRGHLAAV